MILVLVALPVVTGLAIWALGDARARWRTPLTVGSGLITLVTAAAAATDRPSATLRWGAGLSLHLEVDPIARAPIALIALVGLAVGTYALGYGEPAGRSRMVGLLSAFVGAMELLVLAADWLTLLTAWELVGAISWALIGHHWRGDAPSAAGQAFIATRVGDLGLFVAAGAAFAGTGSLEFSALPRASAGWAGVVVLGMVLAAVAKSAQVPFSPWLFSAMAGPTPASALLHSATMVAAGAYLLARLQPFADTVGWFGPVTIAVGLTTALLGGLVAIVQPEAKKLLAASTSAHYGLMFVAVGAGYPSVAIAHLVAHGLFKALLFISAGVAIDASGDTRLEAMRLGRRLPLVAVCAGVGALALAAVPPLGAAWTKEEIVAGAGEQAPWLAALVVLAGLLSAAYAARFHLLAFGRPDPTVASSTGSSRPATEGSFGHARLAVLLLAASTVALGVLWLPWGEEHLLTLTDGELPSGAAWEVAASLIAVALAIGLAVAADRRGRLARPWTAPSAGRVADWFDLAAVGRVLVVDPTLALARGAARFDDRAVDRGVTAIARLATAASARSAQADDRVVDAGVRGVARFGRWTARLSASVGERGFDGMVEGLARAAGRAGRQGRRLQSGQMHQYYAGIVIGLVALVALTALWR